MSFLKGARQGMHNFGLSIAAIINTVLLSIVYFIGIGVTSLVARISGKRFLAKELRSRTYWQKLDLQKRPTEEYYRQF